MSNHLDPVLSGAVTLAEVLRGRAQRHPDQLAFSFLQDGDSKEIHLTYGELDRQARALAAVLQGLHAAGERALLMYPPGLDFLTAFFGCLYAGVVAVPLSPPRPNRPLTRLQGVVADAWPRVVLTTIPVRDSLEARIRESADLSTLDWITTDALPFDSADEWRDPHVSAEAIAFLQYTSGTTSVAKGAIVTHGQLMHNSALIQRGFETTPDSRGVFWLPLYHDMGLIGGVLQTLYCGGQSILLSPFAFLQRPFRWLQAISRTRATISGGPNFAYDYCVKQVTPEQRGTLDLSSWTVAFTGAEPVHADTLDRFAETFASCGFHREAYYPCYGLAEATLFVTGGKKAEPPIVAAFQEAALSHAQAIAASPGSAGSRRLVGCGQCPPDQRVCIVDADTCTLCPPNQIGEIWVRGPSVARGYWNRPEETALAFAAHLADTSAGPFLRTGDLGFLKDGELFVTGRLKDLIIIRGRNHYPQDIERTVQDSHPALRPGCGAAFAAERDDQEQLVVVQELERQHRKADTGQVIAAIRQAVIEHHEVQVSAVLLLKTGSIPKTSSGKIQRHACRAGFLDGTLDAIAEWRDDPLASGGCQPPDDASIRGLTLPARQSVQDWILARLAQQLGVAPSDLDLRKPFAAYGLDSAKAVSLVRELSEHLNRPLSPTLLFDYPNIHALAAHLSESSEEWGVRSEEKDGDLLTPHSSLLTPHTAEPIAIIGMGCRFPGGASDPEAYWRLLHDGVDAITEVPPDRWDVNAYYDPNPDASGKMSSRWAGFLGPVDQFDPHFFGIAPREAIGMDPQQRLLLEVSWEALENAGHAPDRLAGSSTGVYIGFANNDYLRLLDSAADPHCLDAWTVPGNSGSVASGRISYLLGLNGPSLSVDTACSSSIVALHLACRALRGGECRMALAGAVNLILSPTVSVGFSRARMLSPDGRCKTFSADADGYVRGEGCGVVVLKRLSDALADGDRVLAVIRGTAVNQDGHSSGLTAPNGVAQQAVIRAALADAGVEPPEISYVEAHGTGTPLGDPIEVQALGAVLGQGRSADQPLLIGSVKTNIGHLETASGIAGLLKVVLALQHEELPAHLHVKELNPYVPWDQLPMRVVRERTPWPAGPNRRLAGLSSFGFSGTNTHVIIEEAPASQPAPPTVDRPLHLLPLSAKDDTALAQLAARHGAHLAEHPELPVADVCGTAGTGRAHFGHRLALVADSTAQLSEQLANFAAGRQVTGLVRGQVNGSTEPRIAFLFTGQGSQYPGMGRQLYETQPAFRQALERCDELLRPHLEQSLLGVLYPAAEHNHLLHETAYTQLALFALEYALAQLWLSWGVEPAAVLGHSVGEYVAACIAGVFSLDDGLRLIAARGRLMQALPSGGAMAAVFADEQRVRAALAPHAGVVDIAALNGPDNVVISGERSAVRSILERLSTEGVHSRALTVSHAFHSPQMEPMLDAFEQTARGIAYASPRLPLIANVTGQAAVNGEIASAAYWRRHVRESVRFESGMRTLAEQGCNIFVEVGPNPTLLGMARRCLPDYPAQWLPSLREGRPDWQQMLDSLATLYVHGADIDWTAFDRDYSRRRVTLPTYPFQRQRYWMEAAERGKQKCLAHIRQPEPSTHPLLGEQLHCSLLTDTVFDVRWSEKSLPWLGDHRVYDTVVCPAAAYLETALAAAEARFGAGPHVLETIEIHEPLVFADNAIQRTQCILSPTKEGVASFRIMSRAEGADTDAAWITHATGAIRIAPAAAPPGEMDKAAEARCPEEIAAEAFYARLGQQGLDYGPAFRWIERLRRRDGEALGQLRAAQPTDAADIFHLHPGLLDACFQLLGAALPADVLTDSAYVPVGVESLVYHDRPGSRLSCHAVLRPAQTADRFVGDLRLFDASGRLVAEIHGLQLRRAPRAALLRATGPRSHDLLYELAWRAQPRTETSHDEQQAGRWLLFADQLGVADTLAERLTRRGDSSVLVRPGLNYSGIVGGGAVLAPDSPDEYSALVRDFLAASPSPCRGIVHLWNLDLTEEESPSWQAAQLHGFGSVLHLLQGVLATRAAPPRLTIVTRGAQAIDDPSSLALNQAPVWGLARVLALEHPELRCLRIDLDPAGDCTSELLDEITAGDREDQIAFRQGVRHVARLVRASANTRPAGPALLPDDQPFQLDMTARGLLDNLVFRPLTPRPPGPGEVMVRVRATGLNFRDVLNVLGMYPGDPGPLGGEFAGTIVEIGPGVEGLDVGQEVLGLAPASFSTFVITRAELLAPKPPALTFAQAATIPVAFLTAHYALNHLAEIKAGERVLIHAASGGVGLAAIQMARRAGAIVYATAGSPVKRRFLERMGISHIFSSRSLDFADEVGERTNGEGVDVVLNSLRDEFIPRSLRLLRPGGRFLEIGKTDLWDAQRVAGVNPEASYVTIALDHLMAQRPDFVGTLLREVMAMFDAGELEPPAHRIFPMAEVSDAFRLMARARHIGKIVVTQSESGAVGDASLPVHADRSYLITGGLGALGLQVARRLVERGARHVVLAGRGEPSAIAREMIREMEKSGARVLPVRADVSCAEDVARLMREIDAALPALCGVIHAAGVLDDGMLANHSWQRCVPVLAPKLAGAWNLHAHTIDRPLDFFVSFSSLASLVGSPGQGNYAAANAYLDALAGHRRALGMPGLSINWGPWGESGMATRNGRTGGRGVELLDPDRALQILEQLIGRDVAQVGVFAADWPTFRRQLSAGAEPRWLMELAQTVPVRVRHDQTGIGAGELLRRLRESPAGSRRDLLLEHLQEQAGKALGLPATQPVDPDKPLRDLGFDSLMAVELRNSITTALGQTFPASLLFDYPTLGALTDFLVCEVAPEEPSASSEDGELDGLLQEIEQFSEKDLDTILSQYAERELADPPLPS